MARARNAVARSHSHRELGDGEVCVVGQRHDDDIEVLWVERRIVLNDNRRP